MLSGHSISSRSRLCFAERENGRTILRQRQTGGLSHVGKPYWNGKVLLTQVVNPTAGFFAGDSLSFEIVVEEGAKVLLSQPGATRIHTMEADRVAKIHQRFQVGENASLDLYPDLSISQRGSSLIQQTEVHLAETAKCCYLEILTPGRIAHGETLEWNLLQNKLDIFREGKLLARERMNLDQESNWRLRGADGAPLYLASFWVQHTEVESLMALPIPDLEGVQVGWTILAENFCALRVATSSSILMRKMVGSIREQFALVEPCFGNSNALY